jgi:hypothetical protein
MRQMLTSPLLYDLLELLLRLHCAQVKCLHDWSSSSELRGIVWRWRKLLDDLAPYASRGLFPAHHRTVSKVALHEEDHLFVPYKNVIAAHNVQPSLQ